MLLLQRSGPCNVDVIASVFFPKLIDHVSSPVQSVYEQLVRM